MTDSHIRTRIDTPPQYFGCAAPVLAVLALVLFWLYATPHRRYTLWRDVRRFVTGV